MTQLYNDLVFTSFVDLQSEFTLPRSQFYKYLKPRHALQAQVRTSILTSIDHLLMSGVLLEKIKRETSRVYSILLHSTHDASILLCRKLWEKDLGAIDGDKW